MNKPIIGSILVVSIAVSISFYLVLNYIDALYHPSRVSCYDGVCEQIYDEHSLGGFTIVGLSVIPVIVAIGLLSIVHMSQNRNLES